jgi:hypothetical protein
MAKKKEKEEKEKEEKEEEEKGTEDDDEESFGLKKIIKILIGLALIVVGLGSYYYWWPELLLVVKGSLGVFVALIGLVVVMIGWSN